MGAPGRRFVSPRLKSPKIVILDAAYCDRCAWAAGAGIAIHRWEDPVPCGQWTAHVPCRCPYTPGRLYRRELPVLLQILRRANPWQCVVVDGYALLGKRPGLGWYVWRALRESVPVIGVAKNPYRAVAACRVFRGGSRRPLWVTSCGMSPEAAARYVAAMHGPFRLPTMARQAHKAASLALDHVCACRAPSHPTTSKSTRGEPCQTPGNGTPIVCRFGPTAACPKSRT